MEDVTQDIIEEHIRLKEVRTCSKCGLHLPAGTLVCPKDGVVFDKEDELGKELSGRYEFISVVASGGMGVIYKARQLLLDKVVAIKMLHSHLASEQALARFQQEAKAASNLDHPGIIKVHDFGLSEHGQAYMVMDFIEGKSLAEIIKEQKTIPAKEAVEIFIEICDAIAHAHSQGILHRDIKPGNIMVTTDLDGKPRVKIVDFGIAKIQHEVHLTQTGEIFGSPLYMSPEQARGQRVDHRSDIYSLGCVMYEMLTGDPPLIGDSVMETVFKQMNEKPVSILKARPDLQFSTQLSEIVDTTLQKKEGDRYQNIDALKVDLKKLSQDKLSIAFVNNQKRRQLQLLLAGVVIVWAGAFALYQVNNANKSLRNLTSAQLAKMADGSGIVTLDLFDAKVDNRPIDDRDLKYIGKMKSVKVLNLRWTNITDAGLADLENLKNLEELRLSGSKVTGPGLAHLRWLPNLKALSVSNMQINSEGFAAISELNLKELHMNHVNVTVKDLEAVGKIKSLERLMLQASKTTDDGLVPLKNLANLNALDLSHNKDITNKGIVHLRALPNLQQLNLQRDSVDDGAIGDLSMMTQLTHLDLSSTDISDKGLMELTKLKNLRQITLTSCVNVTTKGVDEFSAKLPGCTVK